MDDSVKRFKIIENILRENDLGFNFRNMDFFKKLYDKGEIEDKVKVAEIVNEIKEYDLYLEERKSKYPENIMQFLRKRKRLDEYDISRDEELNQLTPNEAFKEVVNWNNLLGGWDNTIKEWVKDIYGIDLNKIKEKIESEE